MSDNLDNKPDNTFRSLTGHVALERKALILSEKGDDIRALQVSTRVLEIRLYHATIPPLACSIDTANAHTAVARVLEKIIVKLRGENATLESKYRAQAANHYYAAWKIIRSQSAWNLFINV